MNRMVGGLGVISLIVLSILLVPSAFPQSTPNKGQQTKQPVTQESVDLLKHDSVVLPAEFKQLTDQIKWSQWTCGDEGKASTEDLVVTLNKDLSILPDMADTIDTQGRPELPELSDATYAFGLAIPSTLVLNETSARCTGQPDLTNKFAALSLEFTSAFALSHDLEQALIEAEEGYLQKLFQTLQHLQEHQAPVAPQGPKGGKA